MGSYVNTFVQVATDCPVHMGIVPLEKKESKTAHRIQYELLSQHPYAFTQQELIYKVYLLHKQIPKNEIAARGDEIWQELFERNHPCLRASMLPKKYGWGVHYDKEGKIAIYAMESEEYQQFMDAGKSKEEGLQLVYAMRSTRG
ncbi:DUF6157 family protein [Paenibacillus sp. N3.4]|uniref:DUF6157 family protein n=1 Tax=Paenibacillus sp. N3.4 TaxID=2603222 RepID=UPI0011C8B9D1|nr:DUF6157 family protein [Paenibacillus sp. N3.4]TXK68933.1 hypothetical protein FU659_34255 [Paenibacillus sp. N3.4]